MWFSFSKVYLIQNQMLNENKISSVLRIFLKLFCLKFYSSILFIYGQLKATFVTIFHVIPFPLPVSIHKIPCIIFIECKVFCKLTKGNSVIKLADPLMVFGITSWFVERILVYQLRTPDRTPGLFFSGLEIHSSGK